MKENDLASERLAFEKEQADRDFQIKEKEIELRKQEIALKEKELLLTSRFKFTPVQATIFTAIIGIIGTLIVAMIQGNSNQKLEKLKFESELILKAATSDSIEQNKKNLKFLLSAGFLTDEQGKIKKLVEDSGFNLKIDNPNVASIMPEQQSVYICNGKESKAYHKSAMCRELVHCTSGISRIELDSALKLGRAPCEVCLNSK
ncbi:MAG TPA: hypothetical protein VGM41_13640 [Chitinophagaceae bacterium]|jgi:hypothetical protein